MKIFITSGGTKVPIDPVRYLTNMSNGTFGAKIATEALNQGNDVFYYISKGGASPFTYVSDFYNDVQANLDSWMEKQVWCNDNRKRFCQREYKTYDDYANELQKLLCVYQPDIIILAAAVSDYVAEPTDTKIKSSDQLTIYLKPAEKIIKRVKEWCPTSYLVGFKLLVGATEDELLQASENSIRNNKCDLVVANDLEALKSGNHEIMLVEPASAGSLRVCKHKENLASSIIDHVTKRRNKS